MSFPPQAIVDRQLAVYTKIVLNVTSVGRPLLANKTNGIDGAAACVSQQERGERGTALSWIVNPPYPGQACILIAEAGATGNALASKAIVMANLHSGTELDGMAPLDPSEVVVKTIDRVFTSIVGSTSPRLNITEIEVKQVLAAIGNIGEANFVFPVCSTFHGRLKGIVTLAPIVAAGIEVVQFGWAEGPIPTETNYDAGLLRIVVIGKQTGKSGRSIGAGFNLFAIVAVVARDAMVIIKRVIALDANLCIGFYFGSTGDKVIVIDVSKGSGSEPAVWTQGCIGRVGGKGSFGDRIEFCGGNLVTREWSPCVGSVGISYLRGWVVNRK